MDEPRIDVIVAFWVRDIACEWLYMLVMSTRSTITRAKAPTSEEEVFEEDANELGRFGHHEDLPFVTLVILESRRLRSTGIRMTLARGRPQ
jgi:hypothetical protein